MSKIGALANYIDGLPALAAAPSSPDTGQKWYNTSNGCIEMWDGSTVQTLFVGTAGTGLATYNPTVAAANAVPAYPGSAFNGSNIVRILGTITNAGGDAWVLYTIMDGAASPFGILNAPLFLLSANSQTPEGAHLTARVTPGIYTGTTLVVCGVGAPADSSGALLTASAIAGTVYGIKVGNQVAGTTNYAIFTGTGQVYFSDIVSLKRVIGIGTAHVAGDYAASSGWGTAPTITPLARDTGGRVTVLAQATTGASPTLALTFKDGTYTTAPAISYSRGDGAAPTTCYWALTTITATVATWTLVGTPTAGNTYALDFTVIGK